MVKKSGQTLITERVRNRKSKALTEHRAKKRQRGNMTAQQLTKAMTTGLPDWAIRKP
jgi:hypothetical protein